MTDVQGVNAPLAKAGDSRLRPKAGSVSYSTNYITPTPDLGTQSSTADRTYNPERCSGLAPYNGRQPSLQRARNLLQPSVELRQSFCSGLLPTTSFQIRLQR